MWAARRSGNQRRDPPASVPPAETGRNERNNPRAFILSDHLPLATVCEPLLGSVLFIVCVSCSFSRAVPGLRKSRQVAPGESLLPAERMEDGPEPNQRPAPAVITAWSTAPCRT